MNYKINRFNRDIQPTALKAVGRYGRGLLICQQIRAPDLS